MTVLPAGSIQETIPSNLVVYERERIARQRKSRFPLPGALGGHGGRRSRTALFEVSEARLQLLGYDGGRNRPGCA